MDEKEVRNKLLALEQRIDMIVEESLPTLTMRGVEVIVVPKFLWDMLVETRRT